MYIISTDEDDRWFACLKDSGEEGYIPSNYVTEYWNGLYTEKWVEWAVEGSTVLYWTPHVHVWWGIEKVIGSVSVGVVQYNSVKELSYLILL